MTNLPESVPIILLEPGESYIAKSPKVVELNVCTEKGIDIFDSKVEITGGFPVTSEVRQRSIVRPISTASTGSNLPFLCNLTLTPRTRLRASLMRE